MDEKMMDKDGNIICDKCNGSGMVDSSGEPIYYSTRGVPDYPDFCCKQCKGTGKFTWLEKIFGKQLSFEIDKDEDMYNG
jgi:DnaJ-class molecular chaperone